MNTSLFDDAKKRIVQIELVNELGEKLTSTLELEDLLRSATETIQKTFNYTDVTIFLVDRGVQLARLVAHTGNSSVLLPLKYTQKLSEGIVGWAATHGERLLANNVAEEPRYINPSKLNTKAELAIPISDAINRKKLTQKKAAELIGVDQPKISAIIRGQLSGFTIDRLFRFLTALGMDIIIEAKPHTSRATPAHIQVIQPPSFKGIRAIAQKL